MRYMMIIQAPESAFPTDPAAMNESFESMGRYNTELVEAGVLLAAEGLASSAEGFTVTKDDPASESAIVTDGPFTEAKELIAGFWILDVASRVEAEQWARRCPVGPGVTLAVRRVHEFREFADIAPAEVIDGEAALRQRIAERNAR
ncbi:YciI family protein [Actinomycetospora chiangmaiensis]|uniref:YciI family protein n=1 Tax=Actinomycetospora chiangmaiensis TaxID=402650 RepID=UPI000376F8AE|nr:YciI family protein [Actinomycetospora chiangmaiensis]